MEPGSGDNDSALERDVSMEPMAHHIEEGYEGQEAGGAKPPFPRFAQEFFLRAVADILGTDATSFDWMKMYQDSAQKGPYTPFADHDEWELAWWLIKTVNQHATNEFLKLPIVSHRSDLLT